MKLFMMRRLKKPPGSGDEEYSMRSVPSTCQKRPEATRSDQKRLPLVDRHLASARSVRFELGRPSRPSLLKFPPATTSPSTPVSATGSPGCVLEFFYSRGSVHKKANSQQLTVGQDRNCPSRKFRCLIESRVLITWGSVTALTALVHVAYGLASVLRYLLLPFDGFFQLLCTSYR